MLRVTAAFLVVLASILFAHAYGTGGGGSTANNLVIYDQSAGCNTPAGAIIPGISNPAGYTPASTSLTPGTATLVQLVIGDSISANTGESAYTVLNPTVNQALNIYSGLNYTYQDPVIGASTGPGSYPGRIADKVIAAGKFARVITIDVALGGNCSGNYAKNGAMNHRARIACLYARALGWPVTGSLGTWRMAVIYALGTNDNLTGVTQSAFTINGQSLIDSLRNYGCTGDIFISKMTLAGGNVNAGIQAAQAALINNPAGVYVGADVDSLTGGNRQADATHLNNTGNNNLAALWSTIFQAHY